MTERSESERAELEALADRLVVFTKYGPDDTFEQRLSGSQLELIVTALRLAAQDQKPVAWQWRYVGETNWKTPLGGRNPPKQPEHLRQIEARPLFASPPPAAGWDDFKPTQEQINSACMSYRHDFGLLDATGQQTMQWMAGEWLRAWQKEIEALRHNAPPDSGARKSAPPDLSSLPSGESVGPVMPDHGGADAGVEEGWTGRKCPHCKGTGENLDEEDCPRSCQHCGGTGDEYGPLSKPAPVAANASEFGTVRGSLDKLGRRVAPVVMPESLKDTIATCYGLLWHVETDSKYIHRARRGLLQWITKDEQGRGIENARAIAIANHIPLPDGGGEQ